MLDIYEKIVAYKNQNIDLVLVTVIEKQGEGPADVGKKMLFVSEAETYGTVGGGSLEGYAKKRCKDVLQARTHLSERYALNQDKMVEDAKLLPMACGGIVTLFYEFIGVRNYVYIFGGGHVGAAICRVLKPLNFHLTLIDERPHIVEEFSEAHVKVKAKFSDYISDHGIKENSFVIVCTPSHEQDYHVINKIIELNQHPKYVGMLCSNEKLRQYLDAVYKAHGRDIDLSYFYAPIGLELGGGAPEDIAISIASEILALHHDIKNIRHMRERIDDQHRYW